MKLFQNLTSSFRGGDFLDFFTTAMFMDGSNFRIEISLTFFEREVTQGTFL